MAIDYKKLIKEVPNFPIQGVLFRDISPLLQNSEALQQIATDFEKLVNINNIDLFVGIESRGFILACLFAAYFKKGFIPLRKAGKLPPPVIQKSYELEYGKAHLELHPSKSKSRVVICDDVLATGGTLTASIELCEKAGYLIEDIFVLINLTKLNNLRFRHANIKSLIEY